MSTAAELELARKGAELARQGAKNMTLLGASPTEVMSCGKDEPAWFKPLADLAAMQGIKDGQEQLIGDMWKQTQRELLTHH
jgi:hypothetical protein